MASFPRVGHAIAIRILVGSAGVVGIAAHVLYVANDPFALRIGNFAGANHLDDPLVYRIPHRQRRPGVGEYVFVGVLG